MNPPCEQNKELKNMEKKTEKEIEWDCDYCANTILSSCEVCGKDLKLKLGSLVYCVNNENGDHFCSKKCAKKYLIECIQETTVS